MRLGVAKMAGRGLVAPRLAPLRGAAARVLSTAPVRAELDYEGVGGLATPLAPETSTKLAEMKFEGDVRCHAIPAFGTASHRGPRPAGQTHTFGPAAPHHPGVFFARSLRNRPSSRRAPSLASSS